ncbi:MAG: Fur family transcriptional regulator, partial [Candidatus Limnocylindria bacterium]
MRIADAVRARGGRMTVQRRLVLEALARSRHHVTAEELARKVRAKHPEVDPSTVYRNLEALEALGHVAHTHLDGRLTRWHRTDGAPHGHLVCTGCGREEEVPLATLA